MVVRKRTILALLPLWLVIAVVVMRVAIGWPPVRVQGQPAKPAAPPKDDSVEVTVAARDIPKKMEATPVQIKKVRWSKAEYDAAVRRAGRAPLIGNQPAGRVTKHMIRAGMPFFEEDLFDLNFRDPVPEIIRAAVQRGTLGSAIASATLCACHLEP